MAPDRATPKPSTSFSFKPRPIGTAAFPPVIAADASDAAPLTAELASLATEFTPDEAAPTIEFAPVPVTEAGICQLQSFIPGRKCCHNLGSETRGIHNYLHKALSADAMKG